MQEQKIQELLQALFKLKYNWSSDRDTYTSDVVSEQGRQNVENIIRSYLLDNRDSELGQLAAKVTFYEEMIKKSTFAPLINSEISDESDKCNLQRVSRMLPDINIDKAEELAWQTDYACFAVEADGNEINKADAGAFFLEGYNYAKKCNCG